ncbi:TerD family protein [Blastococcus sp. CT_GayMR16]|uniref:TerD family protein n=1 Tax=Blastococcus sp. CT_GayMR16 TaxID=2559607 RepID=UPI001430A7DC|nr:TerD family protein [Blastococcus sp. CT_GayMR16]
MSTVRLSKGQNTGLTALGLAFRLVTSPRGGVDTSALVLGTSGKTRSDSDFVFYNQPQHPSGSVRLVPDGGGADAVELTFAGLDAGVEKVLVAASVDSGSIRRYDQFSLVIRDLATGDDAYEIDVVGEGNETAIVLAEVYRRNGGWKLRAVSQGYDSGLSGLATDYGITVDDPVPSEESPSAAPTPSETQAPPKPAAPPPATVATGSPGAGASVSYAHRTRSTAGKLQQPSDRAPAGLPATARPPARPASPPSRRTGGRTADAKPALVTASATWDAVRTAALTDVQVLADMIAAAARGFQSALPSISDEVRELDAWHQNLRSAWISRFPKNPPPADRGNEPYSLTAPPTSPAAWISRARAVIDELDAHTVKLTSDGRRNYRFSMARQYTELVQELPSVTMSLRQAAWDTMNDRGSGRGSAAANEAVQRWADIALPPAPIGPFTAPIAEGGNFTRGLGPTKITVGFARAQRLTFSTERPATPNGRRHHSVDLPSRPRIPIVLDLDETGGFVTAMPQVAEATALSLLSALPPGQVKLDVFDPDRLGESAKFLYGLGDAAEKVIGQKVRTTSAELAQLLVEIEEHITFVTQKYLQGSYDSLTAYNLASGDVSEPYRLLVLYDYPSGFSRDNEYDKEQFDRFQKILSTGRRCGVFCVIVHSGVASDYANRVSQEVPWLSRTDFNPQLVLRSLGADPRAELALRGTSGVFADMAAHWSFEAAPAPAPEVASSLIAHIERGLRLASDVRVDPDRVSELATSSMNRDVARGTRQREPIAAAYDPSTWWQGSSHDEITAIVGRLGAADTARIRLDSQTASSVLIGGRPGSGKSILLHALIMSLTQQYGPDELSLYLVDFKEGVEFKQYATYHLPQAKVVAIESEREFGVSVLESLADEIVRRGQLFREAGSGEETNIGHFRRRTGRSLPRVVLVIDEFQVMFDRDDRLGGRAAELLERVLRTGRAFGVHVILASQTIAGMPALGRHLPNLIPTRVVLQSADADSRLLLSEDNADAKLLQRPGEAILNTKGGLKDANQRFQSTYWDPEDRAWVLDHLREQADRLGHRSFPVVFEGQRGADVAEVDPETFTVPPSDKRVSVPLGTPMTLAGPVRADLRREPGANLLVITEGPGALLVSVGVLGRAGTHVEVLDFGGAEEDDGAALEALSNVPTTMVSRRRDAKARLAGVAEIVEARLQAHDYTAVPVVVAIHGMHRAREFDANVDYDDQSESGLLKKIVRDGPEVGVHVIAWIDKKASVDRRMSYDVLREFSLRLCGPMSREDSLALIDTDDAATLHPGQAVFDDHDQGKRHRLRVFSSPQPAWAAELLGQGRR